MRICIIWAEEPFEQVSLGGKNEGQVTIREGTRGAGRHPITHFVKSILAGFGGRPSWMDEPALTPVGDFGLEPGECRG